MKLYPVMLNIAGRKAVVIGGGTVALRKVQDLIECGAVVTVIAPEIDQAISDCGKPDGSRLTLLNRHYQRGDLDGALLVFSATDDDGVNHDVYLEAIERNIMINAVDDPPNCTFFMPSWFSREGLIVAVSTSGISPSLSARIRRDIEKHIPDSIEEILAALQHARIILKEDPDFAGFLPDKRGKILKQIVLDDDLLGTLVESHKNDSMKKFLQTLKT